MAHPRAVLPPALAGAPFSVPDGRAAGLSAGQLRRASLRAPTRGVRTDSVDPPPAQDVLARCRELVPALPVGTVFCHVTALELYGVDLPHGLPPAGPIHVQVAPGTTPPRRAGVRSHRRPTSDVAARTVHRGVRVLVPELVWVQLAGVLPVRELVVLGDALVRRKRPLCGSGSLASTVAALAPGTRGIRRVREALDLVRERTDSPMESRLRWILVEAGLPCPVVNPMVRTTDGYLAAMPDLAYVPERVAIEYDGDIHRTNRAVWRRDIARRQALEALGWRVITCTADDVLRTPDRTASWVRAALSRATRTPRSQ